MLLHRNTKANMAHRVFIFHGPGLKSVTAFVMGGSLDLHYGMIYRAHA